ncbi:hypothetical protein HD554DRAFT_1450359 [Boletus coccyginus]|nr:hypothetical protein HD554DRAFT_1450359 [Boletus coccyginus]
MRESARCFLSPSRTHPMAPIPTVRFLPLNPAWVHCLTSVSPYRIRLCPSLWSRLRKAFISNAALRIRPMVFIFIGDSLVLRSVDGNSVVTVGSRKSPYPFHIGPFRRSPAVLLYTALVQCATPQLGQIQTGQASFWRLGTFRFRQHRIVHQML